MQWYIDWVHSALLLSAFVQFALLGTLGEVLGILISKKKLSSNIIEWILKALVWGILGIFIKYAFIGFTGFQKELVNTGLLLPEFSSILFLNALSVSVFMNLMFGPFLMFTHRFTDNLITKAKGFAGIEKSLFTLVWFWIPAHTFTFMIPSDYRIGVAALWSIVLGLIMGFFKRKN